MEKELVQLFEKVKKSAGFGSTPEEERCLDALQKLKGFPVSYEVLVATQIGKRLRQLTEDPASEKIQSLASDVVEAWRRVVMKGTAKSHQNRRAFLKPEIERSNSVNRKPDQSSAINEDKKKPQKPVAVRVPRKLDQTSAGNEEKKKPLKPIAVKVPERSNSVKRKPESSAEIEGGKKKVQKLSAVRVPEKKAENGTPDKNRDRFREIVAEALKKVGDEAADKSLISKYDPRGVAAAVESALFSSWGSFTGAHTLKYRSVMYNIKDAKNPDFRRKVLLGEFRPEEIAQLTSEQMASDERRLETEAIRTRALTKCENSHKLEATTDGFKCERCNKRETVYHEVQTRGADEPLTVYITCVSCGYHWNTLGA